MGWASSHSRKIGRYAWLIRPCITRETRASSLVVDSGPCYHPLQISENQSEVLHLFRWYTHTHAYAGTHKHERPHTHTKHTRYSCCLFQSFQQARNKGRIGFTVTKQDVGKLQSAGEVFGKGGPCDAEVTGGGALDFPDERAYDICVCPALPPWCFFGLAFGASFQMRLINLCSNLCIYERIYTAATTFGDCSQVGSGNVYCQNTSNSHGIASCRLLAQEDKEVGIWSTACNGIMISNGVVPFSCKLLSSRMCWKKCLQKTLIKGN